MRHAVNELSVGLLCCVMRRTNYVTDAPCSEAQSKEAAVGGDGVPVRGVAVCSRELL